MTSSKLKKSDQHTHDTTQIEGGRIIINYRVGAVPGPDSVNRRVSAGPGTEPGLARLKWAICKRGYRVLTNVYNGVFGTHWATRIFVPPSRQNRSIRPPTGKYQWASGRIFCTPSSPVHMTFAFMSKRTCQNRLFLI